MPAPATAARNGESSSAPNDWRDELRIVVTRATRDIGDDLWAAPDGTLYLYSGRLTETPRQVSVADALAWWRQHAKKQSGYAAPWFPEDSAAARFADLLGDGIPATRAELEDAVRASAALVGLLTTRITHPEGDVFRCVDEPGQFDCGLMLLASQTNRHLFETFYGQTKGGVR
jgi:hypothetical protein